MDDHLSPGAGRAFAPRLDPGDARRKALVALTALKRLESGRYARSGASRAGNCRHCLSVLRAWRRGYAGSNITGEPTVSTGPKTSRPRSSAHRGKSTQQRNTIVFSDEPPQSASMTDYDRQHLALYVRLLDAAEEGAEWTEVVRVLFGLDPKREGERARRVYDSHLARALWMTHHGYADLLRSALH
jgi:hypothetical protein